ncbi:hypothetical protein PUN28_009798 [Cardiocondyla obscurior]|uniref:Uncharacterized protein n=1 Tax=Cardiocondyla obscurior TaxID=286306 RepID=A0AAW2FNU2_9HYME
MAEQDILDIFGDSLSDLSDEEAGPQQVPAKKTDPPDPKRDVPRVGSSIQRGDQAQRRHTQWLSEPPPMRRPGRRPPSGPTAGRRTRDAVTTATEGLEARAAGRPPPRPRVPTAPVLPGPMRPPRPGPAIPRPGPPFGPRPRGPPPFGPSPFGPRPRGPSPFGPPPFRPPPFGPRQAGPALPPPEQRSAQWEPAPPATSGVINCGAITISNPPGSDDPYIRVKLPTEEIVDVPVSAVWKNRKFRARTANGRWLLRFEADGTLRTCRRLEDTP